MKLRFGVLVFLLLVCLSVQGVSAGFFDMFINDGAPEIRYCNGGECSLSGGIDLVKDNLNGIETQQSASQYIQSVALYLLTFVSLIAVLYIVYAGFQIMTGNGDEEKLKNSKQTVMYVIFGIILMWLAWPITTFIFRVLN